MSQSELQSLRIPFRLLQGTTFSFLSASALSGMIPLPNARDMHPL